MYGTLVVGRQCGPLSSLCVGRQVAHSMAPDMANFGESRVFLVLPLREGTLGGEHLDHV